MSYAATGHQATLSFSRESEFAGGGGGETYPFGWDATLDTAELSRNETRHYEPGSRDPGEVETMNIEGSFSVEFTLTNPFFLTAAIGGTDGDYSGETPDTLAIHAGTGEYDRTLVGCVVNSMTVSVSEQDSATVTLDGWYCDETSDSGSQPTIENPPMQFHHASLNVDGSTFSITREAEYSVENNADPVYGLGSPFAASWSPKQRETDVDWTTIVDGTTNRDLVYGGTSLSESVTKTDAELSFVNAAGDSIDLMADGLFPGTLDISGVGDPEAELEENMSAVGTTPSASSTGFTTV